MSTDHSPGIQNGLVNPQNYQILFSSVGTNVDKV